LNQFSWLFVVFVAFGLAMRVVLARRQVAHVTRHRDAVPPAFAAEVPLEAHRKAADYTVARTRFALLEAFALEGALVLFLTLGGALAAIDAASSRLLGDGHLRSLATLFALMAAGALAAMPFDLYRTFVIEARFGFNRSTPALFWGDFAKGLVLAVALGGPLAWLVLWFIESAGRWWWLYTWFAWIAFTLALVAVFPKYIAPLFNRFTPLPEGEVRTRIERLLERCGFRAEGLYVMDGSKRSSHGNAYFTGFGRAKRIVFFDTLVDRLSPGEVEAVLAHELGHYARGHIWRMLSVRFALALALLALLGWVIDKPWFHQGLGLASPHAGAALALFFIAVPVFTFPFQPIASWLSRRQEFEADEFAASRARGEDLERALVKLYRDNAATLTPDPLHSLVYDSHPPAALRIAHLREAGRIEAARAQPA
jgi:STE24 endopeptidase